MSQEVQIQGFDQELDSSVFKVLVALVIIEEFLLVQKLLLD